MFGFSSLYIKLIGGVIAALILAGLVADRGRWMHRAHGDEAQLSAICGAARAAADNQKLDCKDVPAQIAALGQTIANVRAAAVKAAADDAANLARVKGDQAQINQETSSEYEARLAAARAVADKLRAQPAAQANPGSGSKPSVPGLPAPASGPAQTAGDNGFSIAERLTATEQAIQLDELIKWVEKQAGVDVGNAPVDGASKP